MCRIGDEGKSEEPIAMIGVGHQEDAEEIADGRVCSGLCASPHCRREPARCRSVCARHHGHPGIHLCCKGRKHDHANVVGSGTGDRPRVMLSGPAARPAATQKQGTLLRDLLVRGDRAVRGGKTQEPAGPTPSRTW